MTALDLFSAISVVFILGMIWLRTRMHYRLRRPSGRKLQLEKAGRAYFACAIALLAIGWVAAPPLGAAFWPATAANPLLTRVIWFLLSYYVFIFVHQYLKARGIAVFKAREDDLAS